MSAEPQLNLFERAPSDPNLRWLEDWLQASGKWWTAAQIRETTAGRLNDREVRALASASEWIISGQRGYKHIEHATAEEITHAAAWLESQAKKMSDRACSIRRNAHRVLN